MNTNQLGESHCLHARDHIAYLGPPQRPALQFARAEYRDRINRFNKLCIPRSLHGSPAGEISSWKALPHAGKLAIEAVDRYVPARGALSHGEGG